MKNLRNISMFASLMTGCSSAFIYTPLPVRSMPASKIQASCSATMALRQQHPSEAQMFNTDFDDVRKAFETSIDDSQRDRAGLSNTLRVTARTVAGAGAVALAPLVTGVASASAKGGAYGIIEGKTASFLHPIIMGGLFTLSVRAAFLGFAWREQRTMSTRMSTLKEQLPLLSSGSRPSIPLKRQADGIRQQIEELGEDAGEATAALQADLEKVVSTSAMEIEAELEKMTARRKELSTKNVRDRHFDMGSILLGLGTFAAIEGPVNTFLRAEKLFPGPHLYAGAGCVVAWAAAASLVPAMQKGNEVARTAHIAINLGAIGLFAWQITTGIPIAIKVWEFTKFP